MENWKKTIQNFRPALEHLMGKLSGVEVEIKLQNQEMADVKQTTKVFDGLKIYKTIEEKFQVEALFGFRGNWLDLFSGLSDKFQGQESADIEKMVYNEVTESVSSLISESLENIGIELQIDPFSEISSKKVKTVLNLQQYVVSTFKLNFNDKSRGDKFELIFAVSVPNDVTVQSTIEKWDRKNKIISPDFSGIPLNVAKNMDAESYVQNSGGNVRYGDDEGTRVEFEPFDKSQDVKNKREIRNIDMLKDVEMQISVELGRTRMPLGKILQLMKGSVIELEKLAGEPVDILVNGRCIAMGDVVVIDEHFGVRITKLMAAHESMKKVS